MQVSEDIHKNQKYAKFAPKFDENFIRIIKSGLLFV